MRVTRCSPARRPGVRVFAVSAALLALAGCAAAPNQTAAADRARRFLQSAGGDTASPCSTTAGR